MGFETVNFELGDDKVATLTLNRPERLNAFNRRMCEEIRDIWNSVREDPLVNSVVLRAQGDRAFCAGFDVKEMTDQPKDAWASEDPGQFLSPKQNGVFKPVICAVQGICSAGAFYFLNEADVVICSESATFFDSHLTFGMVSAAEPVGLLRRVGLAQTMRMALMGNDERVVAQTALQIGLVTEITSENDLWSRAAELAAQIASKPPIAVQATVAAIWRAMEVPYSEALRTAREFTQLSSIDRSTVVESRIPRYR